MKGKRLISSRMKKRDTHQDFIFPISQSRQVRRHIKTASQRYRKPYVHTPIHKIPLALHTRFSAKNAKTELIKSQNLTINHWNNPQQYPQDHSHRKHFFSQHCEQLEKQRLLELNYELFPDQLIQEYTQLPELPQLVAQDFQLEKPNLNRLKQHKKSQSECQSFKLNNIIGSNRRSANQVNLRNILKNKFCEHFRNKSIDLGRKHVIPIQKFTEGDRLKLLTYRNKIQSTLTVVNKK